MLLEISRETGSWGAGRVKGSKQRHIQSQMWGVERRWWRGGAANGNCAALTLCKEGLGVPGRSALLLFLRFWVVRRA